MNETEYITVTNRAKLQMVEHTLRRVTPGKDYGVLQAELALLIRLAEQLRTAVNEAAELSDEDL